MSFRPTSGLHRVISKGTMPNMIKQHLHNLLVKTFPKEFILYPILPCFFYLFTYYIHLLHLFTVLFRIKRDRCVADVQNKGFNLPFFLQNFISSLSSFFSSKAFSIFSFLSSSVSPPYKNLHAHPLCIIWTKKMKNSVVTKFLIGQHGLFFSSFQKHVLTECIVPEHCTEYKNLHAQPFAYSG